MDIGEKIKEIRTKKGLTQKELADKLNVTYQAVSRWENGDAEPSISTIKEMCGIFECPIDELLGMEKQEEVEKEENVKVVEKVIVQEAKPILAMCDHCKKAIYDENDIVRVDENVREHRGGKRGSVLKINHLVLCNECNDKRIEEKQKKEKALLMAKQSALKSKRNNSYIWGGIVAAILIALAIFCFVTNVPEAGIGYLVLSVFGYCFTATMILNNTFINELWLEVCSWGFVKLPGIIFEFDLDGIAFLIAMKILFFLGGIFLALIAAAFATVLALILSVFVYPFALSKNLKGIVD